MVFDLRQIVSIFPVIFVVMAKLLTKILSFLLLVPVYFYRWFISPLTPPSCRHVPTCSQFAIDAFMLHGPWRGIVMATGRILRCRPGGTHGYDPVPRFVFKKYRIAGRIFAFSDRCNRLKERD
ncbi:MAG TPA: membrane protein insertion efficiency factor YidD [Bacteroidales bacterium]|nr:membrane protein insertion efficiency factor YidD [Bacteroidales bacterium]